ncbi:MAG: glycosyltransferase family 9 protein [Steroidobacteraceae bacterium]
MNFSPQQASPPQCQEFATLHLPSQRQLTAAIASLQLFVSADAGPMHLASTTDTPTIGLFKVTDPALYGPLKAVDRTLSMWPA